GSRRSSSRTRWRTTKDWGPIGSGGEPFGPIARPTKARCAPICCRCRRRGRAMSATIPTWNAMTRICGPMNVPFSPSPARPTFKAICYDYRTNVDAYPQWQAWMREQQPRLLVIWGKYDLSFDLSEPQAYRRDVPSAHVHIL